MYKTMLSGLESSNGNVLWRLNKWKKHKGKLELCESGFHCSKRVIDAMHFVAPGYVTKVEVRGEHLKDKDKEVWSEMRVVKTYKWTKKDSLKLAIFSAELCIENFEKEFPNDDRPRKAIEAAKLVLKSDTAKNRSTAESAASATWSTVESAESAVRSAASAARSVRSAASAARSAESAAWSAARSTAWSAARSARSAARSAAWSAADKKYDEFLEKTLDKIEDFIHTEILLKGLI